MFRKTKIVCTLGPSTDKEGVLKRLIEEGMNVARFNFSHGSHEEHQKRLDVVKKLRKELDVPLATLLDTKGPEIRLGKLKDGKAVLEKLTGQRKEEAEDDDLDWEEEVLGEMEGGYDNRRFSSYWNSDNNMTYPLILAKIPVKNPWELFAWLPFGNWNECPDTPELMAVAKYWFEQHGAVPAAMSHDELEFLLPAPVSQEKAMEVAAEQYGFCPDIVDQEQDDPTVGNLADVLRQSTVWYFWWD